MLRRSTLQLRAAKCIVDSSLAYTRVAACRCSEGCCLCLCRLDPFHLVCDLSIDRQWSVVYLPIMSEAKKDEVMQVEDAGDTLVRYDYSINLVFHMSLY